MSFIDSHCHLPNLRHKDVLEKILADAEASGVTRFINIGTSLKENAEAIEVAQMYKSVYATVAIFPHEHRGDDIPQLMEKLEEQAKSSPKVVAIGECGLDISDWKNQRPVNEQISLFKAQIELAQKLNLPLVVHNRNADDLVIQILADTQASGPKLPGVIHCFDSNWTVAQNFLNLGLYLSFSGKLTYQNQPALAEVAQKVPPGKYLLETDAPYLLPEPAKSLAQAQKVTQKNEPKYVKMVGQKMAELRQLSLEQVALETSANARRLFGLPN